jgi:hypothetical protein
VENLLGCTRALDDGQVFRLIEAVHVVRVADGDTPTVPING